MKRYFLAVLMLALAPVMVQAQSGQFQQPSVNAIPRSINSKLSDAVNLKDYGVKADGFAAADGAITSGTSSFSAASRNCASADVGKTIVIAGAGTSTGPLQTIVSACNGNAYTLANSAETTASSALWAIGTDDSAALNMAISDNPNRNLVAPRGIIVLSQNTVPLSKISLTCERVPNYSGAARANIGSFGTTFVLASASVQPFTVDHSVSINGCHFYWPGQAGLTSNPVAYPPLFTGAEGATISNIVFDGITVLNAYTFFEQNDGTNVGNIRLVNSNVYGVDTVWHLKRVSEAVVVSKSIFNPSLVYQIANVGAQRLLIYSNGSGKFLHVTGDGTSGGTCSTYMTGGFLSSENVIAGYGFGVYVQNGSLDEAVFDASTDWTGVNSILTVDAGSTITRSEFHGKFYVYRTDTSDNAGAFRLSGTCSGGLMGQSDLRISGFVAGAQGSVIEASGSNLTLLDVSNLVAGNYGNSTTSGTYYFANINAPNATVSITGSKMFLSAGGGSSRRGVRFVDGKSLTFTANTADRIYNMVDTASSISPIIIVGNVATNTKSTYTVPGSFKATTIVSGNNFDLPNPDNDNPYLVSFASPLSIASGQVSLGTVPVAKGGTNCSSASGTCLDNITGFSSTGLQTRTASGTYAFRTITGTANEVTVSNGDGVSGAPTLSLPSALTFTGKTITGGAFTGGTINNTIIGGTTRAAGSFTTVNANAGATITGSYLGFGTGLIGTCGDANVIRAYDSGTASTSYGIGLCSGTFNVISGGAYALYVGGGTKAVSVTSGGGFSFGATALTVSLGAFGLAKVTTPASAPGAAGGEVALVCGTNAGSAKLIALAGTSTTPVTIIDNIGSGVTGC